MVATEGSHSLRSPAPSRNPDRIYLTVLLAMYAVASLVAWWISEPVTTWDSPRYVGGDIFLFLNPGIPPTVLFSLIQEARIATLVQVVLYAAAWSSLVIAIFTSLRATWIKWPLSVLALIVSLTSPLWSWTLVVGSEGLTVVAIVVWVSTFVWLAGSARSTTLFLSFLAASALLITRPQTLIFVLPIQAVLSIWWIRRESISIRALRSALVVSIAVLVAATGWATYRVALLANDDVYSFRYALHNLVEKTPSFRQYALNEAPPCDAIPAALNGPQPWTDVIAFDNTLISLCPETFIWFKSDQVSPQAWVLYDPGAAVTNFRDVMWGIALPVGAEDSLVPNALDDTLLPVHNVWLATGIALVLGIALGVFGRIRYRITGLGVLGVVISVGAVSLYLFAVWAADGYDVIRHLVPITPLLPVVALVLPSALTGKQAR
ncbi:MAG: hypothetical protein K0U64_11445 [Actinomycetia bacterium]|nr:hypothetical protein [Actinomycetes bacterium]